MSRTTGLALAALALAACAHPGIDPVRYENRDPVWVVNDRRDVPQKPEERKWLKLSHHFDGWFHLRLVRFFEVEPRRRAANVNSLGEVPDSTWFTNRIGRRAMSVDEVRRGPHREPGAMAHKPWTVKSSKGGGTAVGFLIEDSAGERYLIKFDGRDHPEMETAADVIVDRLLYAIGYNVPDDSIVHFRPDELHLAPDATTRNVFGEERPLTRETLEETLASVHPAADGRYRAVASRIIEGEPLGGWSREGVRPDDPNDRVPHQLRRDLRGAYAVFSWLSHTDVMQNNTLDMWVEDPANPTIHYVEHYLIDFGKSLGVQEAHNHLEYLGHANVLDFSDLLTSTVTLGLYRRSWEGRRAPPLRGVGLFGVSHFDPGDFHAFTPSYFPITRSDRFDNFWAAKILIRFTEPMIRAVVAEAELSDPRAAEYLVKTLIARQRRTAGYWFARVNPLDGFALEDGALCFDDLAVRYRLDPAPTVYRARAYGADGRPTGWGGEARGDRDGHACLAGLGNGGSYTIVEVRTRRLGRRLPPTLVHLAPGSDGALRIIGIRRL